MSGVVHFVVPGSLETRTGGYAYDRKIIEGLRNIGWTVRPVELGGNFPNLDAETFLRANEVFGALPDGALVVVDGLAFGVLPEIAEKERTRLRLVALVHHPLADETGLVQERRQKLAMSESKALGFARHVVVTSAFTCRRLVELGVKADKISIAEPGVIAAPLATGGQSKGPGPGQRQRQRQEAPMQMLCPASYTMRKGHADLLRALSGLRELPWKLICVGNTRLDEVCYAEICTLCEALALTGQVELRGEARDDELDALYSVSDLVVLASYYEGFGMVVTEALARGLPVITTTGGALADTLPSGAGLGSAPGDIDALRENLHLVLADENIYPRLVEGARIARQTLPNWTDATHAFAAALKS